MIRLRPMDDAALVEAIARGDERAAAELFRLHRGAMHGCALSILRDPHDAEDAVQTAMTKAIAAAGRDRPRRLRPWLLAIARNEALMLLRSRVPREALSPDLASSASVEGSHALREELSGLVVDLRGLPDRQRSAIVLRHLHELSYRDIGELLGVRPATARQAVLQARRSLLARADARAQDCGDVRVLLAGDGRSRRSLAVRAHLEACAACRAAAPSGLGARIRSLLPVPEPLLPPILLRLLGGPGMNLRTGGAAAACVCTFVIGLGLVERGPGRGGHDAVPAAPGPVAQAPGGDDRLRADRRARRVRRTERGASDRLFTRAPERAPSRPAAVPSPPPAAEAAPASQAAAREPKLPLAGDEDERRPHVTVEVVDEYSVTVDGWDLRHLPAGDPRLELPEPPAPVPSVLPLP